MEVGDIRPAPNKLERNKLTGHPFSLLPEFAPLPAPLNLPKPECRDCPRVIPHRQLHQGGLRRIGERMGPRELLARPVNQHVPNFRAQRALRRKTGQCRLELLVRPLPLLMGTKRETALQPGQIPGEASGCGEVA